MNRDGIIEFLSAVGVHGHVMEGEWVQASCPAAFSRHKSGTDHNPSFGINVNEEGKSGYHCFSCGMKGHDLGDLLLELQHDAKIYGVMNHFDFTKARTMVENEDDIGYVAHEWTDTSLDKQFEAWPEWWLDKFPSAWAHQGARTYLQNRGVLQSTAKALDLRFDPKREMVCFPIRHQSGFLAGFRGRHLTTKRYHDYVWNQINNTSIVLYGESWIDPMQPVVVVEGPFDLAAVYPHYKNVVALFMASVNKRKMAKLQLAV